MKLKKIYGPPGTGKTTRLINAVERALARGFAPHEIGYFTFTNKAADEAITRASAAFKIPKKKFIYFRTLHSFAFKHLCLKKDVVLGRKQYAEICNALGLDLKGYVFEALQPPPKGWAGDRMIFCQGLAAAKKHPADISEEQFYHDEYERFCIVLEKYKKNQHYIDFNDMLIRAYQSEDLPSFRLLIIDEAQDLSALQWDLVLKLAERSTYTLMAGDDDQAIFQWAGADPETFVDLEGEVEILNQSYRLPIAVHKKATELRKQIKKSYFKEFNPRNASGKIAYEAQYLDVPYKPEDGTWAILARNKFSLAPIKEYFEYTGTSYVHLNTIHGAKGGEWDNVVLLTDISPAVNENYEKDPDSELRVFYTGVTRARENLYIVSPSGLFSISL
jgi:DNA helicase-2/ATP-dependent DNA helicase PcrA